MLPLVVLLLGYSDVPRDLVEDAFNPKEVRRVQ